LEADLAQANSKQAVLATQIDQANGRIAELNGQQEITAQKLGLTQTDLEKARSLAQGIRHSQQESDAKLTAQIGQVDTKIGEVSTDLTGAKGDITGSEFVAWSWPQAASYNTSPLVYRGFYYTFTPLASVHDSGSRWLAISPLFALMLAQGAQHNAVTVPYVHSPRGRPCSIDSPMRSTSRPRP
jgi:hypothetical protein